MPSKQYDTEQAMAPGRNAGPQPQGEQDINYAEFVAELPQEFRAEIEEALAALISYVHSDEGTSMVIDNIQQAKGNEAAQIGISALMAMDAADEGHGWSDSAKVFCGYFAVKEIATIARESGLFDLPEEQEGQIFEQAAKNYIHAIIKNKPTQEEREAEAVRIQKEVEPLLNEEQRSMGQTAAKEQGVAYEEQQAEPQSRGGLLE